MARTVLLADDSVTAQNMGRRILMDAGYEVITVNNGSAALKKIHESPPDLIVLDVYMPGYGGLEVCQRLKESGETMRIPVLLTVGKMEPFKSDEAKRVRADGHIVKPFDASELLAALTKLEDRIVPQNESQRGRKGRGEKRPRLWPSRDSQGEWSDGVAYLAEVKEREAHSELVEDPEAEKAQETIADAELPAGTGKTKPPAAAASLAPPLEFEVQETVALGNVAEQQSSPASQETPVPEPAPVEAVAPSETAPANLAPAQAQEDTSLRSAREETPAEAEPGRVRPSRWIAEHVALTAEEASLELEQEMLKAQAASSEPGAGASQAPELVSETRDDPAIAPGSLPSSAPPVREQPNQAPENFDSGATFAAAAGASVDAAPVVEAQSSSDPPREAGLTSETRAAWDNWQRIRDSVISAQNPSAVAGSVVEALQSMAPEAARKEEKNETGPALENAAVASIVETLLAELKPKLMEEIAKKLKK